MLRIDCESGDPENGGVHRRRLGMSAAQQVVDLLNAEPFKLGLTLVRAIVDCFAWNVIMWWTDCKAEADGWLLARDRSPCMTNGHSTLSPCSMTC